MAAFDGDPKTGWAEATYNDVEQAFLALRFAEPVETNAETVMTVRVHQDSDFRRATLGRFRLALSANASSWPTAEKGKEIPDKVLKALRTEEAKRTQEQKDAIAAHYRWAAPEAQADVLALARLEQQSALLELAIPHVVVAQATTPSETRILPRGNWMDDSGAVVEPAIPAFLGKLPHWRPARHAARPGQLDRLQRQSAHRARLCEPPLAPVFRHRAFQNPGRFRLAGRMAHASRTARLAGGGIHGSAAGI